MDEVVDQPAMRPGFAQGVGAEPAADRGRVCLGRIGGAEHSAQPDGGVGAIASATVTG
jgi:hypothetical protein